MLDQCGQINRLPIRLFLTLFCVTHFVLVAGCQSESLVEAPERVAMAMNPQRKKEASIQADPKTEGRDTQADSKIEGQDVQSDSETEGQRIQADPVGYLRKLYDKCDALQQYRLLFYRQERLGLLGKLGPLEEIRASFRRDPFSVKFEWDDPAREFYESVYVQGQNKNKLIVRERHGFLNFPPQVQVVNPQDSVIWGKSKNPVTDFGLAQVVRRTLIPLDDPEIAKVVKIRYVGIIDLEPMHIAAHHILITRPVMKGYRYTRQDFYIDAQTLLPAGTDLWLPNDKLDARYRYTNIDTNVTFTDADFRLSQEHPEFDQASNKTQP